MTATILMEATIYPPRDEPQWIKRCLTIVGDTSEEAKSAAWDWIDDIEHEARSVVLTMLPTFRNHPKGSLRRWDIYTELYMTEKDKTYG